MVRLSCNQLFLAISIQCVQEHKVLTEYLNNRSEVEERQWATNEVFEDHTYIPASLPVRGTPSLPEFYNL